MRAELARFVVYLFAGSLVTVVGVGLFKDISAAKDLAGLVVAPRTGILGIVIGFYFGAANGGGDS